MKKKVLLYIKKLLEKVNEADNGYSISKVINK